MAKICWSKVFVPFLDRIRGFRTETEMLRPTSRPQLILPQALNESTTTDASSSACESLINTLLFQLVLLCDMHFNCFVWAVSLDRGRSEFDESERQLMSEVRRLRAKLAAESRHRKPPTPSQAPLPPTSDFNI